MTGSVRRITGGCLCGDLRYTTRGAPQIPGLCCCTDCRKASGSRFIRFMGFARAAIRFTGATLRYRSPRFNGGEALRNPCPTCGGLVFGGAAGRDTSHAIHAGLLDEPSQFRPTLAIVTRDRPDRLALPPGPTLFETMPA